MIFTTLGDAMNNGIQKSAASVFKAIDNKLKLPGGGCSDSIAYMEQSSWLLFLFLRYLNDREAERKNEAIYKELGKLLKGEAR